MLSHLRPSLAPLPPAQALQARFVDYVKARKTVGLDELAAEFRMKTAEVVKRVQALEAEGAITGIMDDRGKVGARWRGVGVGGGCDGAQLVGRAGRVAVERERRLQHLSAAAAVLPLYSAAASLPLPLSCLHTSAHPPSAPYCCRRLPVRSSSL